MTQIRKYVQVKKYTTSNQYIYWTKKERYIKFSIELGNKTWRLVFRRKLKEDAILKCKKR